MTMPALPAQGSTNWYGWAQSAHAAAEAVTTGRLTDEALRAASVAAVEDAATVAPTGAWDFTGADVTGVSGGGGGSATVPVTTVASATGAQALSLPAHGNKAYNLTLTGNVTVSLSGGTAGELGALVVYLRQDATAGRTVTFPTSVQWPGRSAPAFNLGAGKYDVVQLITIDGGTTWVGSLIDSAVQPAAAPQAPVSLTATPASGQAALAWTDTGDGGSPITGHKIYRGTSSGSLTLLTTIGTAQSYTDTGLSAATYYYKVTAVNAVGESPQSSEVSAVVGVSAPGNYMNVPNGGKVATPYHASLAPGSSTIDIRAQVSMASWAPAGNAFILNMWGTNPMYGLFVDAAGKLEGAFYNAAGVFQGSPSTVALGLGANAVKWLRALMNPTAGTTTYYTSDDGSTWTQLGATITGLTTTGTRTDGTNPPLQVGLTAGGTGQWTGKVHELHLLIGGTEVAGFDADLLPAGSAAFTGTAGKTWTPSGGAAVVLA